MYILILITIILVTIFLCLYFFNQNKSQRKLHVAVINKLSKSLNFQKEISSHFQNDLFAKNIEELNYKMEVLKKQVTLLTLISNQ